MGLAFRWVCGYRTGDVGGILEWWVVVVETQVGRFEEGGLSRLRAPKTQQKGENFTAKKPLPLFLSLGSVFCVRVMEERRE